MVEREIRTLRADEHRDAVALFNATLHQPPAVAGRWRQAEAAIQPGRALGAFDDDLIGTARSADTTLVVRGAAEVPNAAVTAVGVRSDRTRRGVLTELTVHDMHAGTTSAFVGLWRYLLGVDLVHRITVPDRPLDEPGELLFTDPRSYRRGSAADETWLRLIDVHGALQTIRTTSHPLVLEVHDRMLESNSGRYRVTRDGVERTKEAGDLRLDVGTLAIIFHGAWRPSVLASFGRIAYDSRACLETADRVFAAHRAPWCGTHF